MSTLACPFVNLDEAYNSSKVKVLIDENNCALDFSRTLDYKQKVNKNIFHHIGIYGYHKDFLSNSLLILSKNFFEILVLPIEGPKGLIFFISSVNILKKN